MDRVRLIGYWAGPHASGDWPDPRSFVDEAWDGDERLDVTHHLEHGLVARAFMGPSRCRFCERPIGNLELTDGTFVWPEGLAHYVKEHRVRLPAEFVDHVRDSLEAIEKMEYDLEWWRLQG